MKLSEFFEYNSVCPICKTTLTMEGQIDVPVDNPTNQDFSLAGSIYYSYDGKRFHKSLNKWAQGRSTGDKKIIKVMHDKFPETFTINKRFNPRINKTNLSALIKPWFLNSFDVRAFRSCTSQDHFYTFTSDYLFEGECGDNLEIRSEVLDICDFRFYNKFEMGKAYLTEISLRVQNQDEQWWEYENKKILWESLPFIPISKWNTESQQTIKEQLEKYLLLK